MRWIVTLVLGLSLPVAAAAQDSPYGDDSSEWANDGECDDRRFVGDGMADVLRWSDTARDATDCRALQKAGRIEFWQFERLECASVDFGTDSSPFANDGECDDGRFEGLGMAGTIGPDHIGTDASDCRHLCQFGLIGYRETGLTLEEFLLE